MKGTILVNPYDDHPVQKRKAARMAAELNLLGAETEILPNYCLAAWVGEGRIRCDLHTDFVLYFDKERILPRLLEKSGIRVFNSARATEICDDKMLTHATLAECGIPMPDTIAGPLCYEPRAVETDAYIRKATETLGLPLVVKECHGSFGEQVYLCDNAKELKAKLEEIKTKPYLLQRFEKDSRGRDMRVIVIGGKTVCGMLRTNERDFRSNAALGGRCEGVTVPSDIAEMCEKAAEIIGLDYCGIDVLLTDPPKLCEVNSNAMFEMAERATGFNVARAYAEHIVKTVKSQN